MITLQDLARIQQERLNFQNRLNDIGVTEEFISELVETFYGKVRDDELLGPIFAAEIQDWAPHLAKMKAFWGTVILKKNLYSGKPLPAHQKLNDVTSEHFQRWLLLFEETISSISLNDEVVEVFMEPANRMAARIESAMGIGS